MEQTITNADLADLAGVGHNPPPVDNLMDAAREFERLQAAQKILESLVDEIKSRKKALDPVIESGLQDRQADQMAKGLKPDSNLKMANCTIGIRRQVWVKKTPDCDEQKMIRSMERRGELKPFVKKTYNAQSLSAYYREVVKDAGYTPDGAAQFVKENAKSLPPGLTLRCDTNAVANGVKPDQVLPGFEKEVRGKLNI